MSELRLGQIAGTRSVLALSEEQRGTHMHVVGASGTGKSTFLEYMIRQDIAEGRGLCLIDPHGELAEKVLAWASFLPVEVPNLHYIAPHRDDWTFCYNLFRNQPGRDTWFLIDSLKAAAVKVWGADNTLQTPRLDEWLGNVFYTILALGMTLPEGAHLLEPGVDRNPLRMAVAERLPSEASRIAAAWRDLCLLAERKPTEFEARVGSTQRRLAPFVDNPRLRRMFGVPGASMDLANCMDDGAVVLFNLAPRGRLSAEDGRLVGTLLLADFFVQMFHRTKKRPFTLYIDEFQDYATKDLARMLDQARKFGLRLVLAHQRPGQLEAEDRNLYRAVRTNARTRVVFGGIFPEELEPIAKSMALGVLDPDLIKREMYSTTVVGYSKEYWISYGSASGVSRGTSAGSSTGTGTSAGFTGISPSEAWQQHFAISGFDGVSSTNSLAYSESESIGEFPVLVPQLGQQLSAIYYRSLDEQLYQFMAILHDQEQRHAMVRAVGQRGPVPIVTPIVRHVETCAERIERECLRSWRSARCFLPSDEADAIVTGRKTWLFETLGKTESGEEDADASHEAAAPSRRAIMLEPMIHQISTMKIRVEDLELQPRDIRLLLDLFEGRIIRIREAAALYYDGSDDVAKRRLRYMAETGLLKDVPNKSEKGKPPVVYAFAAGAFRLLAEHGVLQGFSPKEWDQKLRKRFTMAASTLEHELTILEFRAAMVPAIDTHPAHKVMEFGTWPEVLAFKTKQVEEGKVRTVVQKPDGYLCVAKHGFDGRRSFLHFFIEVDRGTEELKTLASKAERYRGHYRSGGFADWLGQPRGSYRAHPFRVLMVLPSDERAANVARAIGATKQVWIGTHQDVRANPLGAVWMVPGISTERRCALLDDPSSP